MALVSILAVRSRAHALIPWLAYWSGEGKRKQQSRILASFVHGLGGWIANCLLIAAYAKAPSLPHGGIKLIAYGATHKGNQQT